jgi:hypothetical protein
MGRRRVQIGLAAVAATALGAGGVAIATSSGGPIEEQLTGYEEVPALSSPGVGEFHAFINRGTDQIRYRLDYRGLESPVTQAHIHFENRTNNGAIVVFLCSNLGNGPAGTQACPAGGGTVRGIITPADVGDGAAAQGIAAGEFDEFVRAVRAGSTYVNVHTEGRPSGEVRAQIGGRADRRHHDDH